MRNRIYELGFYNLLVLGFGVTCSSSCAMFSPMNHPLSGKLDNIHVRLCLESHGLSPIDANPTHSLERCVIDGLYSEKHPGESLKNALGRYGFKSYDDHLELNYTERFGNSNKTYTDTKYKLEVFLEDIYIRKIKITETGAYSDGRQFGPFQVESSLNLPER